MSFTEKLGDFTARRQYSLIIGGWAASLGVAATIISRNKYQTFPQKVHTFTIYGWIGLISSYLALSHLDCTSSYVGSRVDNRIVDRCWCTHTWSTTSPSRRGK
jgi:hypothetical protein